jgi:chaperone modulatory protein CbpM
MAMDAERIEAVLMEQHRLTLDELDERWGLSRAQLRDLIEQGVLEPAPARVGIGSFSIEEVAVVRTACRLQQDLELDAHAVGVVLELLRRVQALEEELNAMRARLPPETEDEPPEAEVIAPARS